jgi:hypothetical protein
MIADIFNRPGRKRHHVAHPEGLHMVFDTRMRSSVPSGGASVQ